MASALIQYLRLMIEAYQFDNALQTEDEENELYEIESTTVIGAFREAMGMLEVRKTRDQELLRIVEKATADTARQLNEAILLNTNELKMEDKKLLEKCRDLYITRSTASGPLAPQEFLEMLRSGQQNEKEEAAEWGITQKDLPRWKALFSALVQDPEILLLKQMLIQISKCRKEELYRDMLKIEGLNENRRSGLKNTIREAFLCRVFGFDQAAASLCGAAIESEVAQQLEAAGAIQKTKDHWVFVESQEKSTGAHDLLQEAHRTNLFDCEDEMNSKIFQKAERVMKLRNEALHNSMKFSAVIKRDFSNDSFVVYTREVIESIQQHGKGIK